MMWWQYLKRQLGISTRRLLPLAVPLLVWLLLNFMLALLTSPYNLTAEPKLAIIMALLVLVLIYQATQAYNIDIKAKILHEAVMAGMSLPAAMLAKQIYLIIITILPLLLSVPIIAEGWQLSLKLITTLSDKLLIILPLIAAILNLVGLVGANLVGNTSLCILVFLPL
ncbi:MAG: hypothetical protein AAF153_02195, partial [Pseudomonadota bacterium]